MQLVEQGKFTLDAPVNRYLGDSQIQDRLQVEKPVTFRHILSHWSGLTAGAETKPIWGRELPKNLEKMVGRCIRFGHPRPSGNTTTSPTGWPVSW